jgi:hypothetical protein
MELAALNSSAAVSAEQCVTSEEPIFAADIPSLVAAGEVPSLGNV